LGLKKRLTTSGTLSLNNKHFFDEVFNELYAPLKFLANSLLKNNKVLAEDVVHDVFTNLLLKKTKFQSKISLKTYLYLSVKNSCYNLLKHHKVKESYTTEKKATTTEVQFSFFDKIIEEEVKYQLLSALDTLPNRCKQVFELSLKGYKNDEIATEMNISVETVKSQKKKGKRLLSTILSPESFFIFSVALVFSQKI